MQDEVEPGPDPLLSSLRRLVADTAAADAARERTRTRVLRRIAEEEATFAGVALDLSERGEVVVVRTASGRTRRGPVVAVGRDFVVVREGGSPPVVVAVGAITSIRPLPGAGPPDTAGARAAPLDVSLATLLAGLAGDRPRVQVAAAGEDAPLAGTLWSAGRDVATLRLDGGRRLSVYVRVAAVAEVVLLDA